MVETEKKRRGINLRDNLDVVVSFGVICIVLMIIIPLPTALLDVFIAFNITLSIDRKSVV